MSSIICTLFEGDYHFGVASLVNSLHNQGYKGDIFAGFRGPLPDWTNSNRIKSTIDWPGAHTIKVATDINLYFLPLETNYHLTNYKPDFMLKLIEGPAKGSNGIFYLDPDIVVSAPWYFFERWIQCGVALCEDINSPMSKNHPTRTFWRDYFLKYGIKLNFKDQIYVNGGFTGLLVKDLNFLKVWKQVQEAMADEIGGLNRSSFLTGTQLHDNSKGPFAPFGKTDQDALNAAVEAWDGEISPFMQEAMGFRNGLTILPHALGQPKPWKWKFIKQALAGRIPRTVDRAYWANANSPIKAYKHSFVKFKKMTLLIGVFISRFYKK